jgi:hypothetical protein
MYYRLIGGARKQPDGTWKDYIIMDSTDFPNGQLFPRIDAFGTYILYLHILQSVALLHIAAVLMFLSVS